MPTQRYSTKLVRICAMLLGVLVLFISLSVSSLAAPTQTNEAQVRVIHASPEAGNVDVFVDGKKTLSDFAFGKITDYMAVPAGQHEIKVSPTGKSADEAVITQTAQVEADTYTTVAAIGTKEEGFGLQAFEDDNTLENSNNGKVRVYHLSPNAGPVNIATGGKTVIENLTYKNASDYLEVPANTYTFDVTATDADATVQTAAPIVAGTVNSVFAIGKYQGEPGLQFVTTTVPEKKD